MALSIGAKRLLDQTHEILAELNYSPSDVKDIDPRLGRNVSGIYEVEDGQKFFIKRINGLGADGRFQRSVAFHQSLDVPAPTARFATPPLLASHAGTNTLAFGYVDEGEGFGQKLRDEEADHEDFARVGVCLATLHGLPVVSRERADDSLPYLPPHGPNAVSLELVYGSTMGQLEMWRIIQRDPGLRDHLNNLVTAVSVHDRVPVHGDLRGDQIFLTPERTWMLDWEDFRLGDAARDLGAMVGEIFYHRVRRGMSDLAGSTQGITDEDILRQGASAIEACVPLITTLWRAYETASDRALNTHFLGRVVGYFGWQLFDRALASGTYFGRISAMDRALAGIGREAILGGPAYAPVLGLKVKDAVSC